MSNLIVMYCLYVLRILYNNTVCIHTVCMYCVHCMYYMYCNTVCIRTVHSVIHIK